MDIKNEKKSNSAEAILIPIIRKLLFDEARRYEPILLVSRIWQQIKIDLGGEGSSYDPYECYTDYGILYRNTITKLFEDKFGAKTTKLKGKRALQFDLEKLTRLEKTYGTQNKIRTTIKGEKNDSGDNSKYSFEDGKDGSNGTTEVPPPGEGKSIDKGINLTHEDIEQTTTNNENVSDWGKLQSDLSEKEGGIIPELSQPSEPSLELPEVFWSIFQELVNKEQQNPLNYLAMDKNTVSGNKLASALYDSGQFSRSEAWRLITEAVQSGGLEKVSYDTYRTRT